LIEIQIESIAKKGVRRAQVELERTFRMSRIRVHSPHAVLPITGTEMLHHCFIHYFKTSFATSLANLSTPSRLSVHVSSCHLQSHWATLFTYRSQRVFHRVATLQHAHLRLALFTFASGQQKETEIVYTAQLHTNSALRLS